MRKILLMITMCILSMLPSRSVSCATRKLTDEQLARADVMYTICKDNWETSGVLPSVCITQAFIESTLGEYPCAQYNYWGIASGAESFSSLEEGVERYIQVINNGYYEDAPFKKDWRAQLKAILDGGYCQPVGDYYANACWIVKNYDIDEYDRRMFNDIKKDRKDKKRRKKRKEKKNTKTRETLCQDSLDLVIYADISDLWIKSQDFLAL